MTSLFCDPWMAQRLWGRALVGARQPLRLDFKLRGLQGGAAVRRVDERVIDLSPLVALRRFQASHAFRGDQQPPQRRSVLLVPPFSGGFPFLLRDMVAGLLPSADVFVVEWLNIRARLDQAPFFDFDEQVDMIAAAIRLAGPRPHVVALCQSGPPTLIACAGLAEDDPAEAPMSLSLLGAPMAPGAAPSPVSLKIAERSLDWYERQLVTRICPQSGARRRVYPAEAQMRLMMSTLAAQSARRDELSRMIAHDDGDDPAAVSFMDIATTFMDVPAEHFLTSLERIYLDPAGAAAPLRRGDRRIGIEALSHVPMMSIEGAGDHIAAPGQTASVVARAPAASRVARRMDIAEGVGHFGLFYGGAWRRAVLPRLTSFLREVAPVGGDLLRAPQQGSAPSFVPPASRGRLGPSVDHYKTL